MVHTRWFSMVALVAGLPLCACSGTTGAVETSDGGFLPPQADAGATISQAQLRSGVREAFVRELQWSRLYAMSALAHGADVDAAYSQLVRAEDVLASRATQFYGPEETAALASLLHARAQALADAVAQLDSRSVSLLQGKNALYANASAIAQFFDALDPHAWPDLEGKLDAQIDAILAGFDARAAGDDARAVSEFDTAEQSTLVLADAVTAGLATLFPTEVSASPAAYEDFLLELRVALDDHAFWTRVWMVDDLAHRSSPTELNRATQSSYDIEDAFASVYGANASSQFQYLFHNDTADAVAFVLAYRTGDPATVAGIVEKWNADANQLAQAINHTTWSLQASDIQRGAAVNVRQQVAMIEARFTGNWDVDANRYDQVAVNLRALGGTVANAVAKPVIN